KTFFAKLRNNSVIGFYCLTRKISVLSNLFAVGFFMIDSGV
ncbi:hypothetical protein M153_7240001, partial [Pseudoloma neurophilia]